MVTLCCHESNPTGPSSSHTGDGARNRDAMSTDAPIDTGVTEPSTRVVGPKSSIAACMAGRGISEDGRRS